MIGATQNSHNCCKAQPPWISAGPVARALDPKERYQVRWDDPAYLGGIGFGLVLELERRGFDVGGEPQFSAALARPS